MAARIAKPWAVKPPAGTLVNHGHVYAAKLQAFWLFGEGAGQKIGDSARSRPSASGNATALSWGATGALFNGSSSYVDVSGAAQWLLKTTPFTFIVRFKTSLNTAQQYFFDTWNYPSTGGVTIGLQAAGNLFLIFDNAGQTNYFYAQTSAAFNDGKFHTAVLTYDGSVTASGISIYVDGVKQAAPPISGGTGDPGALTSSTAYIGKARSASITAPLSGGVSFAGLWAAKLSDGAVKALTANPCQILVPARRPTFIGVNQATGTTGTSSATFTTTGTATGAVDVAGTSSQTLPVTGTSTGAVAVAGASAGTVSLTGTATGAAAVAGASSQTVDLAGTATGTSAIAGASSATVDMAGTATGTIPPLAVTGDSAVTIDLAGTATGAVAVAGASSGTVETTGTAAATNPVAGASSATLALTGSAAGAVDVAGASAVTISTTGSATGEVQNFAAVSDGTFTLAGTATGSVEVAGASAQQIELGGAAAFTIRNILGSSAGRVQTSASRTEALNSADRQNTYNPARIAAGSGKRGSNVQTGKR